MLMEMQEYWEPHHFIVQIHMVVKFNLFETACGI